MLSYIDELVSTGYIEWSQSPSILECSPTDIVLEILKAKKVAVPVNSGMLSYKPEYYRYAGFLVAVPVNSGMLSYKLIPKLRAIKPVAVPINFGIRFFKNDYADPMLP